MRDAKLIDSDGQDRYRWYDAVLQKTADLKLMVNFHGSQTLRGVQHPPAPVTGSHLVKVDPDTLDEVERSGLVTVTDGHLELRPGFVLNMAGFEHAVPSGLRINHEPSDSTSRRTFSSVAGGEYWSSR